MLEFLQTAAAQLIVVVAVGAALVVAGLYVIGRYRRMLREKPPSANDLLANFRELHAKGELSDEEFRTIKSMLADRLLQELNDSGQEG